MNQGAVKLPQGNPLNKLSDPRETHHLSKEFAVMFSHVTELLDESVDTAKLKDFLDCYSHPLYPEQPYVHPKIYKDANTPKQVIKSLCPQFINFLHYYLLEDIVESFGCDRAMRVLKQYTAQKNIHKGQLKDLPAPITSGEIEQFHGTIRLKVEVEGNTSDATVEVIGEIQKTLEMATGVKRAVMVYSCNDRSSILLTFLIPENILYIFRELNTEDLTILANSGVMKLEVDEVVVDNIQKYSTVQSFTKPTGLEYYLQQRATDMTSERYSYLLKMLGYVEPKILDDLCSEEFLKRFAKDLQDWRKLATYLSIHDQDTEELVCNYPDENDQKYQALLCWRRAERSTATYYNLLEILILHGKVDEVEALLQRLGEGNWPN